MFLIYYTSKTEERRWMMAETEDAVVSFVAKNDIEDYHITVADYTYEKMCNKIIYLEEKIDSIKKTLKDIIEEVEDDDSLQTVSD